MLTNLILSICMAVLSIVILTQTAAFPSYGNIAAVGPEVIPNYLAYIILAIAAYLAILELVKCIRGKGETPSYAQKELAKSRKTLSGLLENKRGLLRIAGTLVLMFLFAELLRPVGFEICAAVFLVGCMLMNGVRKIWQLVLIPAVTIAVVYIGFVYALRVNIPMLFL